MAWCSEKMETGWHWEWHVGEKKRARNSPSNVAAWHYLRDDWFAPSGKPIGFVSDAAHLGNEMDTRGSLGFWRLPLYAWSVGMHLATMVWLISLMAEVISWVIGPRTLNSSAFQAVSMEDCKSNVSGLVVLGLCSRGFVFVPLNLWEWQNLRPRKLSKEPTPLFSGLQFRSNTPRRIGRLYPGNQCSFSEHGPVNKEASRASRPLTHGTSEKEALAGYLVMFESIQPDTFPFCGPTWWHHTILCRHHWGEIVHRRSNKSCLDRMVRHRGLWCISSACVCWSIAGIGVRWQAARDQSSCQWLKVETSSLFMAFEGCPFALEGLVHIYVDIYIYVYVYR